MCDKEHFEDLEKRVIYLEQSYATHTAVSEKQLEMLFSSVQRLFWVSCIFGGVLLLTVVYGAVGERGFHSVTTGAKELTQLQTLTK